MTNEPVPTAGPVKLALSYEEAADALGISKSKLEKLAAAGAVCSVKIGTRRVFPLRELEAYLDSKKKGGDLWRLRHL